MFDAHTERTDTALSPGAEQFEGRLDQQGAAFGARSVSGTRPSGSGPT